MILFIDNYDSFTYNLVDLIGQYEDNVKVVRNDKISISEIEAQSPAGIVLSPGPGTPADAGICPQVVRHFSQKIPILGVCLGHQCIAEVFGGKVVRGREPVHGKTSPILHNQRDLFRRMPLPFTATRYHSLVVDRQSLPSVLEITAHTEDGTIMGLRHRLYPTSGVQFHPESFLTSDSARMITNWLEEIQAFNNAKLAS